MAKFTGDERRHFKDYLELRLRRLHGPAFQEFAASVMTKLYGDNFVPQCPWGAKGDLSCDGYLKIPPTVFACYGPENGGANKRAPDIVRKVQSDFVGALKKWPRMEEWRFVHNIIAGVPGPVTNALEELSEQKGIRVQYFGRERFETELLGLDREIVGDLISEIPMARDYLQLQPEIVRQVVDAIAGQFSLNYLSEVPVPVPHDKLELNRIPACHAQQIKMGLLGRDVVKACVSDNINPSLDACLSDTFRSKYLDLRAQDFGPGDIVDKLYDFALAGQRETTEQQAAAWAVIAYLFEKCSIFEDKPREDAA